MRVPVTIFRPVAEYVEKDGSRIQKTRYSSKTTFENVAARAGSMMRIECDDVQLTAKAAEDGTVDYSLTCTGKFRIINGGTRIEGENLKHAGGKLTFENAQITTAESVMRTKECELAYNVTGVHVNRWIEPPKPVPAPNARHTREPEFDNSEGPDLIDPGNFDVDSATNRKSRSNTESTRDQSPF